MALTDLDGGMLDIFFRRGSCAYLDAPDDVENRTELTSHAG
jgi:hypothetical protein